MNSLQNQRQILVDYAQQKGLEIVGESFDDNVSGMSFNRKGLGELEDAVDGEKVAIDSEGNNSNYNYVIPSREHIIYRREYLIG